MVENPGRDIRQISWNEYDIIMKSISQDIMMLGQQTQALNKLEMQITGIPRGGLIPAVTMSHLIGYTFTANDHCE